MAITLAARYCKRRIIGLMDWRNWWIEGTVVSTIHNLRAARSLRTHNGKLRNQLVEKNIVSSFDSTARLSQVGCSYPIFLPIIMFLSIMLLLIYVYSYPLHDLIHNTFITIICFHPLWCSTPCSYPNVLILCTFLSIVCSYPLYPWFPPGGFSCHFPSEGPASSPFPPWSVDTDR